MTDRAEEPLRALNNNEAELLQWIFAHGSDDLVTFKPQLAEIRTSRSCTCGCPSIRLEVAENAPPGRDRGDCVIGDLGGKTAKGELVGIILFQRNGRLTELEVYSMDGLAEGAFELPTLDSLEVLRWEPSPQNPNVKTALNFPKSKA